MPIGPRTEFRENHDRLSKPVIPACLDVYLWAFGESITFA